MTLRISALVCASLIATVQAASAACTNDALMIGARRLSITLCDGGRVAQGDDFDTVKIRGTYTLEGKSVDDDASATVPKGAADARVIDDIDLKSIGLPMRLHVTMRLNAAGPKLIRALSLPGPQILR